MEPNMRTTYSKEDVIFLLRDLQQKAMELTTEEKEQLLQSGIHYSEMLPTEKPPTPLYNELFHSLTERYAEKMALYTAIVTEKVLASTDKPVVLVSLARAGTPIGILMKRYIQFAYGQDVPHYTMSILRGRGIDERALQYMTERHPHHHFQFIDGWTGKGAITEELESAIAHWNARHDVQLEPTLAVLADPGRCATFTATIDDVLIPSACLNSTVTGLVSRTVWHDDIVEKGDFHGGKFYEDLAPHDVSADYIETVSAYFSEALIAQALLHKDETFPRDWYGLASVKEIQQQFHMKSTLTIKPGIGETTRVLLRRIPWKVLINPKYEADLTHIEQLAKDRGVPIEIYENMPYACCGLVKELD